MMQLKTKIFQPADLFFVIMSYILPIQLYCRFNSDTRKICLSEGILSVKLITVLLYNFRLRTS